MSVKGDKNIRTKDALVNRTSHRQKLIIFLSQVSTMMMLVGDDKKMQKISQLNVTIFQDYTILFHLHFHSIVFFLFELYEIYESYGLFLVC